VTESLVIMDSFKAEFAGNFTTRKITKIKNNLIPFYVYCDTGIRDTVYKHMEETHLNLDMLKESIAGKNVETLTQNIEIYNKILFCLTAATDNVLMEAVNKLDKMDDFDFESNQFKPKLHFKNRIKISIEFTLQIFKTKLPYIRAILVY
jgi:hypothetical protein